ncbi:MAG: hypothetical protein ACI4CS_00075, partial [Candidatus Weimeria sp.]
MSSVKPKIMAAAVGLIAASIPATVYAAPTAGFVRYNSTVMEQLKAEDKVQAEETCDTAEKKQQGIFSEEGVTLTKMRGVFYGPSGRETYYN